MLTDRGRTSNVEGLFENPKTMQFTDECIERRAERLKPGQFHRLRKETPVLFIPFGTIEWHERHQALGLDAIKAHCLCLRTADRIGGIVMPPVYWGVDIFRTSSSGEIRRGMDSTCDFRLPGSTYQISLSTFEALVREIVAEALGSGFEVIVLLTGHNSPVQESIIRSVALEYNRKAGRHLVLATNDWENAKDQIPWAGDHASKWETSLLMALEPSLVDLELLPQKPVELVGVQGIDPRDGASKELGEKAINIIVSTLESRVRSMLDEV